MSEVITDLTFEASDGSAYTTERYHRRPNPLDLANEARRAPYGSTYFLIGDGRANPTLLEYDITISSLDARTAEDELAELVRIVKIISTVRWGPYTRAILAPKSVIPTPRVGGYRVYVGLWPTKPTWTDDVGTEVSL